MKAINSNVFLVQIIVSGNLLSDDVARILRLEMWMSFHMLTWHAVGHLNEDHISSEILDLSYFNYSIHLLFTPNQLSYCEFQNSNITHSNSTYKIEDVHPN